MDDFSGAFPEELEAAPITGQPAGQTTGAPVMDSPVMYSQGADSPSQGHQSKAAIETAVKITGQSSHVSGSFLEDPQETQEVSRQDNPPANPRASYQGHASAPVPSFIKLSPVQPVVGPFYPTSQRPLKPKLPGCRAVSPLLWTKRQG